MLRNMRTPGGSDDRGFDDRGSDVRGSDDRGCDERGIFILFLQLATIAAIADHRNRLDDRSNRRRHHNRQSQ